MRVSCFTSLLLTLVLSGCAMQRAEEAARARADMMGMNKEQIFGCMGLAERKGVEGKTEVWAYRSGNDYATKAKNRAAINQRGLLNLGDDSLSGALGFEDEVREKRYCRIHIVFRDDRVQAVRYTGPTGGFMTDDEQCAYAVRNCLKTTP